MAPVALANKLLRANHILGNVHSMTGLETFTVLVNPTITVLVNTNTPGSLLAGLDCIGYVTGTASTPFPNIETNVGRSAHRTQENIISSRSGPKVEQALPRSTQWIVKFGNDLRHKGASNVRAAPSHNQGLRRGEHRVVPRVRHDHG